MENKFITNLETQAYNPFLIFQYSDLFEDPEVHKDISQILQTLAEASELKEEGKDETENPSLYETHLSHFLVWISNPLKEEIFIELGIIVSLMRLITFVCIWGEKKKDVVLINDESFDVKVGESATLSLKISKLDALKLQSFIGLSVCPLLCFKWMESRRVYQGNLLLDIINEAKKIKEIEQLFYAKLAFFSGSNNATLDFLAEAMLHLKDTELKEMLKSKKKFYFLNWDTKDDLKELIQKLTEWLQFFDEKELRLQDTGL